MYLGDTQDYSEKIPLLHKRRIRLSLILLRWKNIILNPEAT